MKRGAARQLTQDDRGDEDDEITDLATFNSNPEEIKKRQIKGLPKRGTKGSAPSLSTALTPPISFGLSTSGVADSGFKIPAPAASSTPAFPAFNIPNTSSTPTISSAPTFTSQPSLATFATDTSSSKVEDDDELTQYYISLRGLNTSLISELKDTIQTDAFVDLRTVLTDALKQYEKHFTSIQSKTSITKHQVPPSLSMPAPPSSSFGFFGGKSLTPSKDLVPVPAAGTVSFPSFKPPTTGAFSPAPESVVNKVPEGSSITPSAAAPPAIPAFKGFGTSSDSTVAPSSSKLPAFTFPSSKSTETDDSKLKDEADLSPALDESSSSAKSTGSFSFGGGSSSAIADTPPSSQSTAPGGSSTFSFGFPSTKGVGNAESSFGSSKPFSFASTASTKADESPAVDVGTGSPSSSTTPTKPTALTFGQGANKSPSGFGGSTFSFSSKGNGSLGNPVGFGFGFGSPTPQKNDTVEPSGDKGESDDKDEGGSGAAKSDTPKSAFSFGSGSGGSSAFGAFSSGTSGFSAAAGEGKSLFGGSSASSGFAFGSSTSTGGSAFGAAASPSFAFGSGSKLGSIGSTFGAPSQTAATAEKAKVNEEGEGSGTQGEGESTDASETRSGDVEGSGEENEDTLHSEKSRLYKFVKVNDKFAWKAFGVGFLKLKQDRTTGKKRILFRQESTQKVILNFNIFSDMNPRTDKKAAVFSGIHDEGVPVLIRITTTSEAAAEGLIDAINSAVQGL